jgi:hypothetical protein
MIPNFLFMAPGDLLFLRKHPLFEHVGVYLGLDRILQNTPERGEHVVSYADFANGMPVRIRKVQAESQIVAWRAAARLQKPKKYDPLLNNCEHTANAVANGKAWSPQLIGWILIGSLVWIYVCRR